MFHLLRGTEHECVMQNTQAPFPFVFHCLKGKAVASVNSGDGHTRVIKIAFSAISPHIQHSGRQTTRAIGEVILDPGTNTQFGCIIVLMEVVPPRISKSLIKTKN